MNVKMSFIVFYSSWYNFVLSYFLININVGMYIFNAVPVN